MVEPLNKSFQLTKPLVTRRAGARPAPNAFAAEADVRCTGSSHIGTAIVEYLVRRKF